MIFLQVDQRIEAVGYLRRLQKLLKYCRESSVALNLVLYSKSKNFLPLLFGLRICKCQFEVALMPRLCQDLKIDQNLS